MRPWRRTSRVLTATALFWLLAAGLAAGQVPFGEALNKALDGPRAADAKFHDNANAIAAQLVAAKPPDLEQATRQAIQVSGGIQPTQAGIAWMKALGSVLEAQRAGQVTLPPGDAGAALATALQQAAAAAAQARAGEFTVGGPAPDEEIVHRLSDKIIASEVFRRDV